MAYLRHTYSIHEVEDSEDDLEENYADDDEYWDKLVSKRSYRIIR